MKHIITYIPSDESEICPVCKIYNLTKYNRVQLFMKNCEQLLIKSNNPDLIGRVKKNSKAKKIICFGYKHIDFPILVTSDKEYISEKWFGSQFNTGIFFISNSSSLFLDPEYTKWIESFSHWVGFTETFQPLAEYKDCLELQKLMYKEFLEEIANKNTGVDISTTLKKIYNNYIEKFSVLSEDINIDTDKVVNTMHVLQMNRESIVYG